MSLEDLGKTVAKYAPLLGATLPLPGGAAIGALIAQAFGGDIKDSQDLINRINGDPNAEIKILEIQTNKRIELERLAYENMANARQREIEVSKIPKSERDTVPSIIAFIFIGGYFFTSALIVLAIWSGSVTKEELEPIIQIQKDMGLALMLILAYYFGAAYKQWRVENK